MSKARYFVDSLPSILPRSFSPAFVCLDVFGSTIALELSRLGNDVIGIDLNPNLVSDIADRITQAVIADARNEKVLGLGVLAIRSNKMCVVKISNTRLGR